MTLRNNQNNDNNLGFGTRFGSKRQKILSEDGTFNIQRVGQNIFERHSLFQYLITISWFKFFVIVTIGFVLVNSFFAILYALIGPSCLGFSSNLPFSHAFMESFFFSAQTLSTVGYGRVAPISFSANFLAAIEAMLGLLGFALATGIMYGRFSRPKARLLKSKNVLIVPYKDGNALMFRIANKYNSQLMETEAELILAMMVSEGDKKIRRFYNLSLEFKRIVFFSLSWTIVHPIDEKSPLYQLKAKDLEDADAELMVLFKGFDETFSQHTYARFSYHNNEFIWGAKFTSMSGHDESEFAATIDLSKISDYEAVNLNG
jgi:inward rectifier potassium channel